MSMPAHSRFADGAPVFDSACYNLAVLRRLKTRTDRTTQACSCPSRSGTQAWVLMCGNVRFTCDVYKNIASSASICSCNCI